ncbi:MAG: sulfite exporter TauE/SafE family protein, partial [Magnetococcales bacterium]|nr:sulfite exporter TauE/SafE family protein [Magnetococcales bacterium]
MAMELDWGMVFVGGLLSSGHCLGMCGALVAACSLGRADGLPFWHGRRLWPHMLYHLGRFVTYLTIG